MKTQTDRKKQYAKVVLIISCVFAVISSVLLVITICELPLAWFFCFLAPSTPLRLRRMRKGLPHFILKRVT